MFKKSLAAVAVLAAFAGSAYAADVTMYGRVDLGLRFTNTDADKANVDDVNKFEMASGNYTGSRFGLKGEEDLGNGMKVAFVLENGFDADDGSFDSNGDDKIFGRQASLHLKGSFGEVAFGRMGIMNSTAGTFGIGQFSALETGWGDVGNQNLIWGAGFSSRLDNMVTYATPEFAGAKVIAQYSFGKSHTPDADDETTQVEGKPTTDRYAGIGVTYNANNLALRAIVDTINKKSGDVNLGAKYKDVDDTVRVTVGGSYDFGVVKPFLAASYFKDGKVSAIPGADANGGVYDGYGIVLGANAPLFGGTLKATAGYLDAEKQNVPAGVQGEDISRFIVGAGYEYKLSKRTVVYADAGYGQDDIDNKTNGDKPSYFQAAVGMAHYF